MAVHRKIMAPNDCVTRSDPHEDQVTSSTEAAAQNSLLLSLQQKILDTWNEMEKRGHNVVVKTEKDPAEHKLTSASPWGQPDAVMCSLTQSTLNVMDDCVTSQTQGDDYESLSDETVASTIYGLCPPQRNEIKARAMDAGKSLEWNEIKTVLKEKYTTVNEAITPNELANCLSTLSKLFIPEECAAGTSTSNKVGNNGKSNDNQLSQFKTITDPIMRVDAGEVSHWNARNGQYKYKILLLFNSICHQLIVTEDISFPFRISY